MRPGVLLLAGEASGDEHAASLAVALQKRLPDVRLVGTGGPKMEDAGVELLAELDQLAVMGFAEVLPRLQYFRGLQRTLESAMDEPGMELVVPVDYPGFNLRIARAARRRGRRVLYYIAPKVWAWRPGRTRDLASVTDRVAVVLPFEAQPLRDAGVRAEYVGHPLLDRRDAVDDHRSFRARWGIEERRPILALLPGSRPQEIERHLGLFTAAAERVRTTRPDVVAVVSRATSLPPALFEGLPCTVVEGTRALLRHARAALVKSGTATLEAAIEGTPSVVAYRTSTPTWLLARALLRTEHVALPNLVAGRRIVPEYLQADATPRALADALLPLLDEDTRERAEQVDRLGGVAGALGAPGAAERVADMALELMGRSA